SSAAGEPKALKEREGREIHFGQLERDPVGEWTPMKQKSAFEESAGSLESDPAREEVDQSRSDAHIVQDDSEGGCCGPHHKLARGQAYQQQIRLIHRQVHFGGIDLLQ